MPKFAHYLWVIALKKIKYYPLNAQKQYLSFQNVRLIIVCMQSLTYFCIKTQLWQKKITAYY